MPTSLKPPKPPTKTRFSLNRRPSETLIRKSVYHDTSKKYLHPSVNPVRRSIEITPDEKTEDFIIHYQRKIHSHLTIDSKHEKYYLRHGLPKKPRYNPAGRRFSDSSDTDPDYNRWEFLQETAALNSKESPPETESNSSEMARKSSQSSSVGSETSNVSQGELFLEAVKAETKNRRVSIQLKGNPTSDGSRYGPRKVRHNDEPNCFKSFSVFLRFLFCCKIPSNVSPSSPESVSESRKIDNTVISTHEKGRQEVWTKRKSLNQFVTPSIIVMG